MDYFRVFNVTFPRGNSFQETYLKIQKLKFKYSTARPPANMRTLQNHQTKDAMKKRQGDETSYV